MVKIALISLILTFLLIEKCYGTLPIVINTWDFPEAAEKAWQDIQKGESSIDALENGIAVCEDLQCDHTVGYGGSPDENGETTLDALLFDGVKMDMGAIGGLRRVKNVVGVARYVLDNTVHSLLVGDQATNFAKQIGFKEESLTTDNSTVVWEDWIKNKCQPNYWKNVLPDPKTQCGPYKPISKNSVYYGKKEKKVKKFGKNNHDTIAMIVIDSKKYVVAGTSTNGANHKIPGRVGDSPIPGAGAYADASVGAAGCTGDGDIMMRFLPSFFAVEEMRRGNTPLQAARSSIARIVDRYPTFFGAIIVANNNGQYGAACNGFDKFPYRVATNKTGKVVLEHVVCTNIP